jgi:hypothetical protein
MCRLTVAFVDADVLMLCNGEQRSDRAAAASGNGSMDLMRSIANFCLTHTRSIGHTIGLAVQMLRLGLRSFATVLAGRLVLVFCPVLAGYHAVQVGFQGADGAEVLLRIRRSERLVLYMLQSP